MIVKSQVLHASVKDMILCKICGTNIIAKDCWSSRNGYTNLKKEGGDPTNFRSSVCNRPILGLSGWSGDTRLLLSRPRNGMLSKKENISSDRGVVITVSSPISVRKRMERQWVGTLEKETSGNGASKVGKNSFCCLPMCCCGFMHELREIAYSEWYIWSSEREILKSTNHCSILISIRL